MSTEVLINYSDYYAYAADMHRKVWTSFDDLEADILELDNFLIKNDNLRGNHVTNLTVQISPLIKNILSNFSQISYLEDSFVELSKYVLKKFDTPIDAVLTSNNLKVFRSYAQVSNNLAEPISAENTKEE